MGHSLRDLPGRELKVGHAAAGKAEQHANIGPVGGDTISLDR